MQLTTKLLVTSLVLLMLTGCKKTDSAPEPAEDYGYLINGEYSVYSSSMSNASRTYEFTATGKVVIEQGGAANTLHAEITASAGGNPVIYYANYRMRKRGDLIELIDNADPNKLGIFYQSGGLISLNNNISYKGNTSNPIETYLVRIFAKKK